MSIYVDSNASGANDGTSWTDAWGTITEGLADVSLAAGGVVWVASNHALSQAGAITYVPPASTKANPVTVISVDTAATPPTVYNRGAKETCTGTTVDIKLSAVDKFVVFIGIDWDTNDDFGIGGNGSYLACIDCILNIVSASTGRWDFPYNDCLLIFDRCQFLTTNVNSNFRPPGRSSLQFRNCTYLSAINIPEFMDVLYPGLYLEMDGFDFSGITHPSFEIIGAASPSTTTANECQVLNLNGIVLPAGGLVMGANWGEHGGVLTAYSTSLTAEDDIEDLMHKQMAGTVQNNATIYRNATFDGATNYSLHFTSTTDSLTGNPAGAVRFMLAEFWVDANATMTVHAYASDTTRLLSNELWVEFEYPDATNASLQSRTTTLDTAGANAYILGTAGAITDPASGADWTGDGTNDQYYSFESGSSNSAGVARVWGCLASGAVDNVYFDPSVTVAY